MYREVYLQFKGTWLFKCKQNGQIFDFSSFWSSAYQMHNQIVGIFSEYFWNIMELYPEVYLQFTPSVETKREIPFCRFILHK